MRWLAALLALTCAVAASVSRSAEAQPIAEPRRGRVVDASFTDLGVDQARVVVTDADGATVTLQTDAEGGFSFSSALVLPYEVEVSAEGYAAQRFERVLWDGDALFPLAWDGPDGASRTDGHTLRQAASTTRLEGEALEATPRRNAEELLRAVPGLVLVQHGSEGKGHQFFLRGFDAVHGADFAVSVDGLRLNEWSNVHAQGYVDLGIVLPELVDSVEVVKGPYALDAGPFAMAGAADFTLGLSPGTRVAYTAGTTNRHRVFAATAPDEHSLIAAALTRDAGFGENRAIERAVANGRVRFWERDGHALSLTVLAGAAAFDLPGLVRDDDVAADRMDFYDAYDPTARGTSSRALTVLRADGEAGAGTYRATLHAQARSLWLRENYTGALYDPDNGDRRALAHDAIRGGTSLHLDTPVSEDWSLALGLDADVEHFTQREDAIGRELERTARVRSLDAWQTHVGALAGVRWVAPVTGDRPAEIAFGTRADVFHVAMEDGIDGTDANGATWALSPRASASLPVGDARLFLSYGRGVRPPEARAFGNETRPDTGIGEELYAGDRARVTAADAVEVGARIAAGPRLSFMAAAFGTWIARESVYDHVSGISLELNGTRRLGGELEAVWTPIDWLALSVGATAVDARFRESGRSVPFAPPIAATATARAAHPAGWRAALRWNALSPRPLPHGATGAAVHSVDLTVGYTWRWLELGLEVENLLGLHVREGEYHFASDWSDVTGAPDRSALPTLHTSAGAPLNARLTLGASF